MFIRYSIWEQVGVSARRRCNLESKSYVDAEMELIKFKQTSPDGIYYIVVEPYENIFSMRKKDRQDIGCFPFLYRETKA